MTFVDLSTKPVRSGGTAGMWNNASNTKQVIVFHDTESSAANGSIDWMRSQQNGSYHYIVDVDGDVFRMVPDQYQAWGAMPTGNRIGLHVCATGFAKWSTAQWNKHPDLIENVAKIVGDWSRMYGIPLRLLTPAQVRAGQRGVCTHNDISLAYRESDHTDPGKFFPETDVLTRAEKYLGSSNMLGLTTHELAEVAANMRQLGLS